MPFNKIQGSLEPTWSISVSDTRYDIPTLTRVDLPVEGINGNFQGIE